MTMLEILGSMVDAAPVVAAVAYIRRSRKTKEPLQLGINSVYNHNLAKLTLARATGVARTGYNRYLGGK